MIIHDMYILILTTLIIAIAALIGCFIYLRWDPKTAMGLAIALVLVSAIVHNVGTPRIAHSMGIIADASLAAAIVFYFIHTLRANRGNSGAGR